MEDQSNRLDPRIIRTRQLIRDAFVELLQEMEIEKITVNRLAGRATINRVTFYLHYKDIPDLMDKLAEDMLRDMRRILHDETLSSRISMENMDVRLVKLIEHIADNAKFYKAVLGSQRTPIFTKRLLQLLTELIEERFEQSDSATRKPAVSVQKDIAIWYGSSALIGVIVAWLKHDMPYTPHFLAKQFLLLTTRNKSDV